MSEQGKAGQWIGGVVVDTGNIALRSPRSRRDPSMRTCLMRWHISLALKNCSSSEQQNICLNRPDRNVLITPPPPMFTVCF
eukprot:6213924-Pleurochrysis_carterae.AAC.3